MKTEYNGRAAEAAARAKANKSRKPQKAIARFTRVRITDLNDDTSYIAEIPGDCKDETDKQVFGMVNQMNDVITMGKVIGEPIT